MAEVKRGFQTPSEVTSYFDGKVDRPSFSWNDVWAEEHAYAFTVAKAVDVELRTTLRQSLSTAIGKSQGFEAWLNDLQPELQRLGWWGPRIVSDPQGIDPAKLVDFSSRRRLETIFWSNMRSARAAGQWERAQRTKAALPYLLYVRTASHEPRAEHIRWVGIILPVDHPWWRTHFPPNGWGCKCSVRQITARERDRLLTAERKADGIWYVSEPTDDGPPRDFRNRRTGEVTTVPFGIDPGWHTNSGLARAETLMDNLSAKLQAADPADSAPIVEELWQEAFTKVAPKLPEKAWMPAGVSSRLQANLGAVDPLVGIENAAVASRMAKHGMALDDFARLPGIIDGAASFPDLSKAGEENVRNLFAKIGRAWWRVVVVRSKNARMRVRSIHQRDARAVAKQILTGGFGRADLIRAGFSEEEADTNIEKMGK